MEYNRCSRFFDNADAVEELKLTVNNLKDAQPTLSAIKTSKTLKILTLVCHGGDETISELCRETLEGSKSLNTLILELPECSDKGVNSLIEAVLAIKNLISLTLRLNNVTENGAQSLATILSSTHIESFSIYGTQMDLHDLFIGDKGAEFLAIATQQCATLTKLCIAQSGITGLGVANVVQHLETHPSLMSLNLSYNLIDVNGVSGIAKSLPRIPMLQELILDNNKDIGDFGVKLLANVLNHTQSLKKLSLKSCDIGKNGLASLVERMQGLVQLNLSGNRAIGNEGAEFISQGLRDTETLNTLDLSSCDIRDEGCIHLADAILHNISLVYLSLHGNAISDGGIDSLSTALEKNSTLQHLVLSENRFGEQGTTSLLHCLKSNTTLTHLSLFSPFLHQHILATVEILLSKNDELSKYRRQIKALKQENITLKKERDRLSWELGNRV